MKKFMNNSPIRERLQSPLRLSSRPISPLRLSPFSRQAQLSPLRARQTFTKSALTPTKYRTVNDRQFFADFKSNKKTLDLDKNSQMHKTIKSGMGLFQQQLAHCKAGSERKENRINSYQTQPFQYSDSKNSSVKPQQYSKNSFAALIQGVKEIESFQVSKYSTIQNQCNKVTVKKDIQEDSFKSISPQNISFKAMEDHNKFTKITELPKNIDILESFGSPVPSIEPQDVKQSEIDVEQVRKQQHQICSSSLKNIMALIHKGSELKKEESCFLQESVKNSFDQHDSSLNMKPFL